MGEGLAPAVKLEYVIIPWQLLCRVPFIAADSSSHFQITDAKGVFMMCWPGIVRWHAQPWRLNVFMLLVVYHTVLQRTPAPITQMSSEWG